MLRILAEGVAFALLLLVLFALLGAFGDAIVVEAGLKGAY